MGAQVTLARRRQQLAVLYLGYLLLVAYASLTPFGPWDPRPGPPWEFLLAPWPRYVQPFDVIINVLAYLPVGALGTLLLQQHPRLPVVLPPALAIATGVLVSVLMERLQVGLPPRIPSNLDLLANGLGTVCGALPWCRPGLAHRLLGPLQAWRERVLLPGTGPEVGALLVVIWCACQCNPSIPLLGAGVLHVLPGADWGPALPDPADWLLATVAAALSAWGLGLFVACLLRVRRAAVGLTLALLLVVMGAKATLAEFLLKPQLVDRWFDSATLAGEAAGACLLLATAGVRWTTAARLAMVALLAGGLLAKLGSHYVPLAFLRPLFSGSFGQMRSFNGLTIWLNEGWPLLAPAFLTAWWPRGRQVSSQP